MHLQLAGGEKGLVAVLALKVLAADVDQQVGLQADVRDELGLAVLALELFVLAAVALPVEAEKVKEGK